MTTDPAQRRYLKHLGRLRRVNTALAQWDAWDAHGLMPGSIDREMAPPLLDREQLTSLRAVILDALAELDVSYERG
jgi:hypothetical protein